MEILDETTANWLVQHDDGTTETIGKSNTNKALIDHDLWGLLRDGTEVLVIPGSESRPQVTVIPDDEAKSYTLQVGDYEGIHLGPHQKTRLVDALIEGREKGDGDSRAEQAAALIRLFDDIRENQVRTEVISGLAEVPIFAEHIEDTPDGWFIHDHLLLTWEGDFHHPTTTSYERSGSTVSQGSSEAAYQMSIGASEGTKRDITLDGKQYRLTTAEMEFIAKALWAVKKAPRDVT